MLYRYHESLHIEQVFYKIGGREHFDEVYEHLLEKQKQLNAKDKMNVLYVALTRAIESMIVIRKPKSSIFDALGMRPMEIGILRRESVSSISSNEKTTEKMVITHYGVQEVKQSEEEEEKDYEAILFGTALHYTLEMMSTFTKKGLEEAMTATKNRYGLQLSLIHI